MRKILIIDDDRDTCLMLRKFLSRNGFEVQEAYQGKKALDLMEEYQPDIVLSDFRLGDMDGTEVVQKMKDKGYNYPVIIITAYSDIKTAVEIMKMGAVDYVTKPLFPDEILLTIKKILENPTPVQVSQPVAKAAKKKVKSDIGEAETAYIFGTTPAMREIKKQVELVAPTDYSVIIHGESGSGKEGLAQAIHLHSKRKDKPFVAIDCGALTKELATSELFGHEKGSFTGAAAQKTGSFEMANGGTIFLDEIGNLSYEIQVGLLRVIQERKVRRVGGTQDIPLDVRIIVASNEHLWNATKTGKFREDLYHRFNEFSIDIPPLRDRKADIMTYALRFLEVANEQLEKDLTGFDAEVEHIFTNYIWHGNLRELKNVIKRSALLSEGPNITARSLPFEISNYAKLQFDNISEPPQPSAQKVLQEQMIPIDDEIKVSLSSAEKNLKKATRDAEYEMILQALKKTNYNKSKAAKLLDIDRKTLYNKMQQYQEFNNS